MHSKSVGAPVGLDALWGTPRAGTRGPVARHTTHDVARAGIDLADQHGLGGVTLGAVAKSLGLTTTALYRYVDTKDVLLDLMADIAFGDPPESTGADWRTAAHTWSMALHAAYLKHPWLSALPASGVPRRPGVYAWLDRLAESVDGQVAAPLGLALTLDALVRGFATVTPDDGAAPAWLSDAVARRFPRLPAAENDWGDPERHLAHALDALLTGFATGAGRRPAARSSHQP